jgi:hypothetical protein
MCGAGIVGNCLVGPHVLPHRLTGSHYGDFLWHNLPKILEVVPPAEHECGTCVMVLRHILAVLCEIFSITAIMTDGQVVEDAQHGLHSPHIWIPWIFTCRGHLQTLVYAAPLENEETLHHRMWMPVRLSATTPASLNEYSGSLWDVPRRTLNITNILSIYCKCTLSAVTHKFNASGYMLIRTLFSCCGVWTRAQKFAPNEWMYEYVWICALPASEFLKDLIHIRYLWDYTRISFIEMWIFQNQK